MCHYWCQLGRIIFTSENQEKLHGLINKKFKLYISTRCKWQMRKLCLYKYDNITTKPKHGNTTSVLQRHLQLIQSFIYKILLFEVAA